MFVSRSFATDKSVPRGDVEPVEVGLALLGPFIEHNPNRVVRVEPHDPIILDVDVRKLTDMRNTVEIIKTDFQRAWFQFSTLREGSYRIRSRSGKVINSPTVTAGSGGLVTLQIELYKWSKLQPRKP